MDRQLPTHLLLDNLRVAEEGSSAIPDDFTELQLNLNQPSLVQTEILIFCPKFGSIGTDAASISFKAAWPFCSC